MAITIPCSGGEFGGRAVALDDVTARFVLCDTVCDWVYRVDANKRGEPTQAVLVECVDAGEADAALPRLTPVPLEG